MKMKKVYSILFSFLLLLTMLAPSASAASFKDTPESYRFYEEINFLTGEDIITGFPDGRFGPEEKVTRAAAAIMIGRALDLDGTKGQTVFPDVAPTSAASGYIQSAVEKGIIGGFLDGSFRPDESVTRGQLAIFLTRAFEFTETSTQSFTDVASGMTAYPYIQKLLAANITAGYPDNTYRPELAVTRGQFSAFIARSIDSSFIPKPELKMQVHFIDVGQGDSILIQSPNGKNMLVDGGTKGEGAKVVSFLKSKGVSTLDVVVATHPDADHIGGLISVLNNFKVGQFIDSGKVHTSQTYFEMLQLIDDKNIPFKVAKTGDKIALDSLITTTVLHADENASSTNGASIATRILYGSVSFLLTGDAEATAENKMLSKYGNLKSTYLKAGHHGSNSSSTATFINSVKPAGAIFSYGEGNQYGHPHAEVVSRLNAVGSKIYSTAQSGDITVTTNGTTHGVTAKPWVDNVTPKPVPKPEPKPVPKPTPVPKPDLSSGTYVIPGAPTSFQNC